MWTTDGDRHTVQARVGIKLSKTPDGTNVREEPRHRAQMLSRAWALITIGNAHCCNCARAMRLQEAARIAWLKHGIPEKG
jgi:hypothetical protein